MAGSKRVAVMSPQTRIAHSRRKPHGRWRVPRLDPRDTERALRNYRAQRARGIPALAAIFGLLLGLPTLFALFPGLTEARVLGIPASWLMLAALPYPAMVLLARWQLRRAERVEDT